MTCSNIPISAEYFADYMHQCGVRGGQSLAVAVSGGSDSMALLRLMVQWVKHNGDKITALTVDHGLRSESQQEAMQVADYCKTLGVAHETLSIEEEAPKYGVQAWAREQRYQLLCDWCHENNVKILALGHHRDDQVETILMRRERDSGVRGLAGMSVVSTRERITLIRPLLAHPKQDLIEICTVLAQPWIEDPSNSNDTYKRVQLRQLGATLSDEEIKGYAEDRQSVDQKVKCLLESSVELYPFGYAKIASENLGDYAHEIQRYALKDLVMTISGSSAQLRNEKLDNALDRLKHNTRFTFAGCLFVPEKQGWCVQREPERAKNNMVSCYQKRIFWDGRFRVEANTHERNGCYVGALTVGHYHTIKQELAELPAVSPDILAVLPAIYNASVEHLESLVAVPHLNWYVDTMHSDQWRCWFSPRKPLVSPEFTSIVVFKENRVKYG